MISRTAAHSLYAMAGALLLAAGPAAAQGNPPLPFPVTGKICSFGKEENRKALIRDMSFQGESAAHQAARLADFDNAVTLAAIEAKCAIVIDTWLDDLPDENRIYDLHEDVERLRKRVDLRAPGAAMGGICTVSIEEAKAIMPPEGSPGLEPARAAVEQAAKDLRCGIVIDTARLLVPADSLDVTGKVMARVMGLQAPCVPGDIATGYWRGRRCVAMGGSWTARLNNDERRLVFRGTAGQRVRLTARRVDQDSNTLCRPEIRLRGPYWKSQMTPLAQSPGPNIKINWFEYVLPDTTDYTADLFCIYEMRGAGTEELSVALEEVKG